MAIVGGAKVSTKLDLLGNLVPKVDTLVIGGGMANTFLAAQGEDVGKSLGEHDMPTTAQADHGRGGEGRLRASCCRPTWWSPREFKAHAATRPRIGAVPADT